MSRTLVYRTSKEFDKCAEHLRNILNVQESRQDSKSPSIRKMNRKKQQQSSINTRTKKRNSKSPPTKSSFIRTNINSGKETSERRSPQSSIKNLHAPTEEPSRLSPNKNPNLISSLKSSHSSREKSPLLLTEEELIRSSSCSDLPSSKMNLISQEQTYSIHDEFIKNLTHIKNLSKQIRIRNSNSECYYLWNEFDKSLSSALSYANHDLQLHLSLTPLRTEIIELRKQLQITNIHLHKSDLFYRNNEQYVDLQKKFNTNQIQCTQLLLDNQELKTKCNLLQNKLDHLQRNNTNLIQRLTQQDLQSISKNTEWISTNNCFLLRNEIIFLKDKLYHVYDDLSLLFEQNQILEKTIREQNQQLKDLKQSAQQLLYEIDDRFIEEKIKTFLNNIIIDQQKYQRSKFSSIDQTPTPINSSSFHFDTSHKRSPAPSIQSNISSTTKLRPKSLFITPNILNDSNILSKFPNPINDKLHCSSSTIDDADSISTSTSSLYYQDEKHTNFYNSFPSLTINITKLNPNISNNESTPELDQISDLTSKIFNTSDEEDLPNNDIYISTSSSSTI